VRCVACQKEIPYGGIAISFDGDFVCNQDCKRLYRKQMDYLCSQILPDEGLTEQYIMGKIDIPEDL